MNTIAKLLDRVIGIVVKWFLIGAMIAVSVLVLVMIGARFMPWIQIEGGEELIELGFSWVVFMGTLDHCREGTLFRVTEVVDLFPPFVRRLLHILVEVLVAAFGVALAWYGWDFAIDTSQLTPYLRLPKQIFYVCMPVAGLAMTLYAIRDCLRLLRGDTEEAAAEPQSLL